MAKTFSLSFPSETVPDLESQAQAQGLTANQLLREIVLQYLQGKSQPPLGPATPELQQLAEQVQQLRHLQGDRPIQDLIAPVSARLQQLEARVTRLCEVMEKLTAALERDRSLLPGAIKRQESFLEAVYVLVEKVLLYTSPEELRTANQTLADEIHAQLEKFLEE